MILTGNIILLLLVIAGAIVMFAIEWVPMEVTALAATGTLLLFNVITPEDAISGFSNKAVITIGAMFILSRSLVKTGFLEVMSDRLSKSVHGKKWPTLIIFYLTVSLISGFINNTAAVAIFIPMTMNLCKKFHISPTRLLMPLSYAAIFGGTLTLIGTSTNLVVSSVMEEEGIKAFKMFEFTKLGLIFLAVGSVYNMILARWWLPSRSILSSLATKYHLGKYITEFRVGLDSILIGKTYGELESIGKLNVDIIMIIRENVRYRFDLKKFHFRAGDLLLVRLDVEDILRFKEELGLLLLSDIKLTQQELSGKNHVLVETIIGQNSSLIGKTLKEIDFRQRFFGFVLAIRRHGENLFQKIAYIRLKFSDTLLIMIPKEKLARLRGSSDLIVAEELDISLKYEKYWWLSVLVIPMVMILAALNIFPLVKGAVLGTILLLLLRSLSIEDAYEAINWPVIFMIAALVPLGIALRSTGTDVIIGKSIIYMGELFMTPESPNYTVMVSLIYLVSFIMTAFISNTAIAIVMTPIAIALAHSLGIDPRPFLVGVAFGSSASFMTPMGYQTNLMVYGPGQYRFWDFIKAGFPLTIIFWGIASYFIPKFWSF